MRYSGKLFFPHGAKLTLDISGLSAIQGKTAYELYVQFKSAMANDEFDAKVQGDAPGKLRPVQLRFRKVGDTSAYVLFEREVDDTATANLQAAMALLSRLDPEEDASVIEHLRRDPDLQSLADSDWTAAAAGADPLAAAFFTAEDPLNDPLIHGLMNLAGAAFFDRLGLLE
jgi:hypothetical protein